MNNLEIGATNFDEFIHVRRLSWAGVQISVQDTTLVIDPLETIPKGAGVSGNPRTKVTPGAAAVDVAVITHMRDDHYDVAALNRKLSADGIVVCLDTCAGAIIDDGFKVVGLKPYEATKVGPFTITALPAVDGMGDDQASFLIEVNEVRILHCGDTLWHGYWYRFARDYGPINVAFLPINGALINVPGVPTTGVPVVMTPSQAAAAADILCASIVCPMHYGMFNHPPGFVEWPNALSVFVEEATKRNIGVRVLSPGEEILLDRVPPSAD